MLLNKRQYRKVNDRKTLHKVHKKWVVVSTALLGLAGAGFLGASTQAPALHADSVNTNTAHADQISVSAPKAGNIQTKSTANNNVSSASSTDDNAKPAQQASGQDVNQSSDNQQQSSSDENKTATIEDILGAQSASSDRGNEQQSDDNDYSHDNPRVANNNDNGVASDNDENHTADYDFKGLINNNQTPKQQNEAAAQDTDPFTVLEDGNGTQGGNGDNPTPNNGTGNGATVTNHAADGPNTVDDDGGDGTNNDPNYPNINDGDHYHHDHPYYYTNHDSEIAALIGNESRDNQQELDRLQNDATSTESEYASQASANAASSAAVVSAEMQGKNEQQATALSDSAHMQSLNNSIANASAEDSLASSEQNSENSYLGSINNDQANLNNVAERVMTSLNDNTNLTPDQYNQAVQALHSEENSYMGAVENGTDPAAQAGLATGLNTFENSMANALAGDQNNNQGQELSSANQAINNAGYSMGQYISGLNINSDAKASLTSAMSSDVAAASSEATYFKGNSGALSSIANSLAGDEASITAAGQSDVTLSSTDTRNTNASIASSEDQAINTRRENTINAINHDSKLTQSQKASMDNMVNGYANSLESSNNVANHVRSNGNGTYSTDNNANTANGVNNDNGVNNANGATHIDSATALASSEAQSNLTSAAKLAGNTLDANASNAIKSINADPTLTNAQKSMDDAAVDKTLSEGNSDIAADKLIPSVVNDYQKASSVVSADYYNDSSAAASTLASTQASADNGLKNSVANLESSINSNTAFTPSEKSSLDSSLNSDLSSAYKHIGGEKVIASVGSDFSVANTTVSSASATVKKQGGGWYAFNPFNPAQSAPYGYHYTNDGQLVPDTEGFSNGVSTLLPGFYNVAPGYYNPYAYDNGQSPYGLPLVHYNQQEWTAEGNLAQERMALGRELGANGVNAAQFGGYAGQLNAQAFDFGANDAKNGIAGNPIITNDPSYRNGYYAYADGYMAGATGKGVEPTLGRHSQMYQAIYAGAYRAGLQYAQNASKMVQNAYSLGYQSSRKNILSVDSLAGHSKEYIIGYVQGMNNRMSHNPVYLIDKGDLTIHTTPEFSNKNIVANVRAGARNRAPQFVVNGVATDSQGNVRYHVINFGRNHVSGWITASDKATSMGYYQATDARTRGNVVRIIGRTVAVHKHERNWSHHHFVARLHYGDEVRIKGIVRVGSVYRFYIKRGEYMTANKAFVEWLR